MPNETSLPKWAQEELRQLRRRLDVATTELELLRRHQLGPEDTDTKVENFGEESINLPKHGTITFSLGSYKRIRVRVGRDGGLDVNGDGGLLLYPAASNAVRIFHA